MRSSNPMQRESIFEQAYSIADRPMTIAGTTNKLLLLSTVMLVAAYVTYYQFSIGHIDFVNMLMVGGVIVGFILAIVLAFKPAASPYLAPIYALSQGAVVSGISCFMENAYKGIVMQAASITLLTVFVMAVLFSTGLVKATEKFRSTLIAASLTIFAFYAISFILSLFGVGIPYFTQNTNLNIAINVAIALVAAFYLILDFDFIKNGAQRGLPSVFEWYGAFSLLVTVIWFYVEILRLLARLKDK